MLPACYTRDMSDDLQFEKAEYTSGTAQCAVCSQALGAPWWQAGSARVCASCKRGIEGQLGMPVGIAGHVKASAAGFLAVLGCAAIWAAIERATGYQLGIVAIGAGWAIAEVMRRVAGRGSRLLQVIGVFLVYVTIALASIPQMLDQLEQTGPLAWVIAVALSFAFPFLVWMEGVSAFIWYLIVFFGFRQVWSGLAPARVDFQGPYSA